MIKIKERANDHRATLIALAVSIVVVATIAAVPVTRHLATAYAEAFIGYVVIAARAVWSVLTYTVAAPGGAL